MPQIRLGRSCSFVFAAVMAGLVPASAETLTVAWDPNPEPEVSGYVVYVGAEPGVYPQRIDVGNVTQHLVAADPGRQYCFAVAAYSAAVEGARSAPLCTTTGAANAAPTLANPGGQSSLVGQPVTLGLSAVDPEGAPLIFTVTGLPAGLTAASNTGIISGTPTQTGTSTVAATVSDGALSVTVSFSWVVTGNTPGVATLLRPTGAITTTTPTFEWSPVPTATSYRVWIDDASANQQLIRDVTPVQAGCTTTGAICRVSPGFTLVPGAASWSVRTTNGYGDGPWSGSMDFAVPGSQAPTVSILTPTSGTTYSTGTAALALSGAATNVTQVSWSNDRGGSGNAVGSTTWSVPSISLQAGANVITVTARGSDSSSATDVLTVTLGDTQQPTVNIVQPTSAATYSTSSPTLTLAGASSDNVGVTEVRWSNSQGGSGLASGTSTWSAGTIALKPGTNVLTVTARDAAGNTATDSVTISVADGVAPVVSIAKPASSLQSTAIGLAGTASDAFGVVQVAWSNSRGGSGMASGTASWTISGIPVKTGDNLITVSARDAAGNTGQASLSVTVADGQAPAVAILTPVTAATYATTSPTLALTGTAADAGGVASVTWSSSQGGSGIAAGTTSWSVPAIALVPGLNVIAITARDVAGNAGVANLSVTATDTRIPVVRILGSVAMGGGTVRLAGSAGDDFGLARVTWRTGRGASGVAVGTTSWVAASIPIQQGSNDITVTATDKAGNSATDVIKINGWKISRGAATTTATQPVATTEPVSSTIVARGTTGLYAAPAESTYLQLDEPAQLIPATLFVLGDASQITSASTVAFKGTASASVTRVTWTADWGGSGTASGTEAWTISTVGLQIGTNLITVTATTADGRTASQTIAVTYRPRGSSR